jgi:transcriptional regulator with XRE-family HTH domain
MACTLRGGAIQPLRAAAMVAATMRFPPFIAKAFCMTTFSERLRAERVRMGLTQGQFAALGGMTKNTQLAYEREPDEDGYLSPCVDYLLRLGEAGMDVQYVMFGSYQPDTFSLEVRNLLQLIMELKPTQQAVAFAVLSLFKHSVNGNNSVALRDAATISRATGLFQRFLALDDAGRAALEQLLPPETGGAASGA